jgi:hypothetical protein
MVKMQEEFPLSFLKTLPLNVLKILEHYVLVRKALVIKEAHSIE